METVGWIYQQSMGRLLHSSGDLSFQCHSGLGDGKNNPLLQWAHGVGPIPVGRYTIGPLETDHPLLGFAVMALIPDPLTNTFGRTGFYIHGESAVHPGNGSHGCIVHSPKEDRELIDMQPDRSLEVVP
jgi:hypothetical protein